MEMEVQIYKCLNCFSRVKIQSGNPRLQCCGLNMILSETDCPHGYQFGLDIDAKSECEKCEVWDDCMDKLEELCMNKLENLHTIVN